ncbi:Lrp/AsnC family transcriptional regulator [Streptacidiphilus sp. P02-A3a]|uniref:Lrp/AsnC family transcriptional regulator n=1 Tax=Streptacidiphilus sp. P02-A3a TaxID=2704468 RepID=UPI001CDBBDFB|nr:Lrp/AsnC family transcriptional regulator [Streptacidiphilus sp. P02-A3a]
MATKPATAREKLAGTLGLSERTVVRRATPLLHDGTLRPTAVRNPSRVPGMIPMALRIRCRPDRITAIAAGLARRPDTVWVDVLGGGDEISAVLFLDSPQARTSLLLRDLPATPGVRSWDAYDLMKVFPAGFVWSAGLLTTDQFNGLTPSLTEPRRTPEPHPLDDALIDLLAVDSRAAFEEPAARLGVSASTVRRRLGLLVSGHVVRLAGEVDPSLLGVDTEALLWIATVPGRLETIGQELSRQPRVRFAAATTGPANLLVAVAAEDLGGLYGFLTGTVGAIDGIRGLEVTRILSSLKRTGRVRPPELSPR